MAKFQLQIITPREIFYDGEASIITLKISEGYVGIMANRMPLMSSVKISSFTLREEANGEEKIGIIGNGIIKTDKEEVTIIVNDVLWVKEASRTEIDKKLNKLKDKLSSIKEEGTRKQKVQDAIDFWELALKEVK